MDNEKIEDLGNSSDDEIELKPQEIKPKKVLTEKQKETLAKGREIRNAKRHDRISEKQRQQEEEKKVIEEKIVKKAIAIKKKQIRKQKIIDVTPSEDETDIDEPAPVRRKPIPKAPSMKPVSQPVLTRQPKVIFL